MLRREDFLGFVFDILRNIYDNSLTFGGVSMDNYPIGNTATSKRENHCITYRPIGNTCITYRGGDLSGKNPDRMLCITYRVLLPMGLLPIGSWHCIMQLSISPESAPEIQLGNRFLIQRINFGFDHFRSRFHFARVYRGMGAHHAHSGKVPVRVFSGVPVLCVL